MGSVRTNQPSLLKQKVHAQKQMFSIDNEKQKELPDVLK